MSFKQTLVQCIWHTSSSCCICDSPRSIVGSSTNKATRYTNSTAITRMMKITTICNTTHIIWDYIFINVRINKQILKYNCQIATVQCTVGTKKFLGDFWKPAVCKYPTTVNNSEIYILLPKPCPWMWHLMCGNRVRFGSDRMPETGKTHSLKLAHLKIPIGGAL